MAHFYEVYTKAKLGVEILDITSNQNNSFCFCTIQKLKHN